MSFEDFRKMNVWQLAFKLLIKLYKVTADFPKEEKYGMVSDMRRAGNSIVHNIAEGFGRYEVRDKTRFYKISRGSAYEVMSQILVSKELMFIKDVLDAEEMFESCQEIIKELNSLINSLESKLNKK